MSRRILIGTDEAGYGPNLGPLTVTATAWDCPAGLNPHSWWSEFDNVITNAPTRGDSRLFVPALRACGDFHNQQVTANWGFTVIERLLRPIVILVIAVFVFWVYASMMMPLLRLLNNLS